MTVERFVYTLSVVLFAALPGASAQQSLPTFSLPPHGITINVVVNAKSGQPVTNLTQQDFTLLDNKTPRPITSFKILSAPADQPTRVILLLDAVNMPYQALAYTRGGVKNYLKAHEGGLPYPTTLAVLTDNGVQIVNNFSTDGNALNDLLEHQQIGLREITRDSEWSGVERLQICLTAFHQLARFASTLSGRKAVVWISPGWPLVSGPRIDLGIRQEQEIFDDVVSLSNQLRRDDVTLYNVNPWGVGESLERADYYQTFLKAPVRPSDVQLGDLSVQVLAVHTGGLAIESNSDVSGMIDKCLVDLRSWYEITFDPAPADKPNEYHHIEVQLGQRALTARTTDGYYANPQLLEPQR
jgi:VWFA-related protein